MKKTAIALLMLAAITGCKMENPFFSESTLPYGAPEFDKIRVEHFKPAFEEGIKQAKAEIDSIIANPAEPDFENTIVALEQSGDLLENVGSIFYNLLEADTNEPMQALAEEISPMMTEFQMYVSLNDTLFQKVKAVYDKRDSLNLEKDQQRLLENTYKGFVRSGALLSKEDKEKYSKMEEELSLASLEFSKNALDATNAYSMNITDSTKLAGLPDFVREMGAQAAKDKGQSGWTFDLSYPSYSGFIKYSDDREARKEIYMAYNSKAIDSNAEVCRKISSLRAQIAQILGYKNYAEYAIEDRMVGSVQNAEAFMEELLAPSLPVAKKEVATILEYAKANGFEDDELQAWDFSYWSNKYKDATYSLNDEQLKPYFQLDKCIDAVFGLAGKLYGLQFIERTDLPVYHKDVKVYDVLDANGKHKALFYADFFPRESKRGGAWMTEFRGQDIVNGVERRPFVSIVTNFSKPTDDEPSLLTHDELTTFLHEFGHSLHGILSEGRYGSLTGTSVDHDFVELPSQIMENWAFEPEWLDSFARHYKTGEVIPDELIKKIVETKNYNAAYAQVRQLQFGLLDMAWYDRDKAPEGNIEEFEKEAVRKVQLFPEVKGTCISTSFSHIFAGGYAAGYYSYKWAEVLEADAFSLFQEKGIFNKEVADSFRENILSKGSSEKEAELYRRFRGHDPQTKALLIKLGIISK